MAEEATNPVQAEPVETVSVQTVPAPEIPMAAPAASGAPRRGGALLVFLTVLLILVGIADVILWGVAGYYFLRNAQDGDVSIQSVSTNTDAANSASGGPAASDGRAKQEALEAYIREMSDVVKLENEMRESHAKAIEADEGADAYAELTGRTIPLCQQMNESVLKITSGDPEIGELCEMYRDYITKYINSLNTLVSAVESGDTALVNEAKVLVNEASDVVANYVQKLQALAQERNVPLNF